LLGNSINTIKENTETLMGATRGGGLETNAKKTSIWSCLVIRIQGRTRI